MKRWTTEENLSSYEGSIAGSKTDLLIEGAGGSGLMHGSHSNSTDSGIQSVGDSIRGSSDSMGNGATATNGGDGAKQEGGDAGAATTADSAAGSNSPFVS